MEQINIREDFSLAISVLSPYQFPSPKPFLACENSMELLVGRKKKKHRGKKTNIYMVRDL